MEASALDGFYQHASTSTSSCLRLGIMLVVLSRNSWKHE